MKSKKKLLLYHLKLIYKRFKFVLKRDLPSIIPTLPYFRKVTIISYLKLLQYKTLNNVLYINKKLYNFGSSNTHLYSLCKMEEETISHLLYYYTSYTHAWNEVRTYFTDLLDFSQLISKTPIFGFHNIDNKTFLIENHILLLLKLHISEDKCFYLLIIF